MRAIARVLVCIALLLPTNAAFAGAPFITDDPEPVDYRHSEVYFFSQGSRVQGETSGVVAGIDANYGLLPELQIHAIAPLAADARSGESARFGYGDTELGFKYRFLRATPQDWWPQAAIYPLVEVPTGDATRHLGAGRVKTFLPVWVQKDFSPWQAYGGGGYWNNPGDGNRDYWYFGGVVQRKMTETLALGGELFHQTAMTVGGPASTGFNLGLTFDLSAHEHLLFSAGRGFENAGETDVFSSYVALQLTY